MTAAFRRGRQEVHVESTHTKKATLKLHELPAVLIIEDDPLQRKLYKLISNQVKMKPMIVDDCASAIAAAGEHDFALIIMDLQMPDSDGLLCAQSLRQLPRVSGNGTPIIAVTAHAMQGDRERCLASGMDDYLSKPFTLLELRTKIADWTGARAGS